VRQAFGPWRDREWQALALRERADPIGIYAEFSTIFLSVWADWSFPFLCFVATGQRNIRQRDETIL
jgi:hypothetical protein